MRTKIDICFLSPITTAISILVIQGAAAQESPHKAVERSKIGGVPVREVLQRLGAKMEKGITAKQLADYSRHFSLIDLDGDGQHSKVEYIEKGRYMTPEARRGIFTAADNDRDGSVTAAEYTLNRIITDEAKAIVQAMDDDKDGAIQAAEFTKHASEKLKDEKLAEQVFAAFDTEDDKQIRVPEYLRVWGQWARTGQKPPAQRIAARESELLKAGEDKEDAAPKDASEKSRPGPASNRSRGGRRPEGEGRPGRGGPPDRRGRPTGGGAGGFGPFSGNTDPVRPNRAGLKIGSPLPEISIFDADGNAFETADLKGGYSVIVFGCLT
jgi:Ca2+-binding EF-hand superfamily protein